MSLIDAPLTASLVERLPWLDRAATTLLAGSTPSVAERIAACTLLAGATGRRAIEALVAGLDDGASRVRLQAVASLASSSHGSNALRLAHAAFHRRADVQRAALEVPTLAASLVAALLGDPRLADDARAILVRRAGNEPAALAALVVARRQGLVTDDHVAAALRTLPWSGAPPFLRALPAPPPPPSSTPLAARFATMGDDHLIDVLTVVAADDDLADVVAAGLADAAHRRVLDAADLERVAVAVTVVAAMRGTIAPALVAVAAIGDIDVLDDDRLDLDTRRAACRTLLQLGSPRHDDVFVHVRDRQLWQTAGGLDLDVLAGLQRLCRERPTAQLTAVVDVATLAAAFARTPTPMLLSLPPTNSADRQAATALLASISQHLCSSDDDAPIDIAVIADTVVRVADPIVLIDRLEPTAPGALARLLTTIIVGTDDDTFPDRPLAERRLERVAEVIVRRLDPVALAGITRVAAQQIHRPRAVVVVAALTRVCPLPVLAAMVDGLDPRDRVGVIDVVCANVPPLPAIDLAGDGLLAILHRRTPGGARPLDPHEHDQLVVASAAAVGRIAFSMVAGRRRSGLSAALLARTSVPDDAFTTAALLASHDPPAQIAALLSSSSLAAASTLLTTIVPTTLPLLGLCARGDDDDIGPLIAEIDDTPNGFRGAVTLALHLVAPADVVVLEAMGRVARAARFTHRPSSLFDARLPGILADAIDEAHDPARLAALRSIAAMATTTTTTTTTATTTRQASVARPWSVVQIEDEQQFVAAIATIDDDEVGAITGAALLAGVSSARLTALLRRLPAARREQHVRAALRDHHDAAALSALLKQLPLSSSSAQVQRLRELAAWGARHATSLVGRPVGVTWIGGALGFTRLGSARIHINPLPVLLDERDGDEIVMGLIAHELGHHRYHGDVDSRRIWEQAQREHLGQVLNLVADEHLERNLRAVSATRYGHRLQVLAAWAFQHRKKELDLATVLVALGPRAATVLSQQGLGVARVAGAVVVDVGDALASLEQQGSAFSRFMRALRMGKGARFDDPLVERGLALFAGPTFRTSSMTRLFEIARALRKIFGEELGLLRAFDFHAVTDASDGELVEGGLGAEDLDAAGVAPGRIGHGDGAGRGGVSAINVGADTTFATIDTVERIGFDARAHQQLVAGVRRPAATLREVLLTLGEASTTHRRRLRGGRVDRTSLVDVVTRGDPRLLVARERHRAADLFIGVAIDCSGSMRGERLDRARHFAAVIASAAREIPAVDVRFVGFSDDVIYDAGDARRCAVAGLDAHDGNNDAAALWHLAGLARRSARRVKLLVVISDGAPTECSVEALRALVARLGKQGMICAQIAVAPLEQVCFPHHVVVDEDDIAVAVRRFRVVIERLIVGGAHELRASSTTTAYTSAQATREQR